MSKEILNSYEEVISAIINHTAPFTFTQHLLNGKVDEKHILNQIDHVETGYLEPKTEGLGYKSESFVQVVKFSIDFLDGSRLIDVVKESRRYLPYHPQFFFFMDDLFMKAGLCGLGKHYLLTDIPLKVGYPAHTKLEAAVAVDLAVSSFQVMQSGKVSKPTRMKHRRIIESVLLAHPAIQRTVIHNTLGENWLADLENTAPEGRYTQLHDVLTTLVKKPDELKAQSVVGSNKMLENMKKMHQENLYKTMEKEMKTPFIKFLGLDHLLGMVKPHETSGYLESEAVRKMIQTPHTESDIPQLRKEILSYIHRSEFQKDIMTSMLGNGHSSLTPDTPTQRGERVIQEVDKLLTSWSTQSPAASIYKDPAEIPREDAQKLGALFESLQEQVEQPTAGSETHNPKKVKMLDLRCDNPACLSCGNAEDIVKAIGWKYQTVDATELLKMLEGDKRSAAWDDAPDCDCPICSSAGFQTVEMPANWEPEQNGNPAEPTTLLPFKLLTELFGVSLSEEKNNDSVEQYLKDRFAILKRILPGALSSVVGHAPLTSMYRNPAVTPGVARSQNLNEEILGTKRPTLTEAIRYLKHGTNKESVKVGDLDENNPFNSRRPTLEDISDLNDYLRGVMRDLATKVEPSNKPEISTSDITNTHISSFDVHGVDGEIINTFKMRFDEDDNALRISGKDGRVVFHAVVESLVDAKYIFRTFKKGAPQKAAVRSAYFACIRVGGKVL